MSASSQELPDLALDVLTRARAKGVRFWADNGALRYAAPRGALTPADIERLRSCRDRIMMLLQGSAAAESDELPYRRRRFDRAPLTFSQLAHWQSFRLAESPAVRQIAAATRLRGPFDLGVLRESLAEMVARHEALRTQVALWNGVPTQEIAHSRQVELAIDDLTVAAESQREIEARRLVEQHILKPTCLATDPLFGTRLARLHQDDHVLIVAMEHIIADAFSMNVFLRDLFAAYRQLGSGRALRLPPVAVQFADYAVMLRNSHQAWLMAHGGYWQQRLAGCAALHFPYDISEPGVTRIGRGVVPVRVDKRLKDELRLWCRQRRTTMVLSMFTAYVALVLRWCGSSDGVVRYQTDGRTSPTLENTVGYFAAVLNLRVSLGPEDTFVDLLERVMTEYCQGCEHADSSYLDAQIPAHQFTMSTGFNWIPAGFADGLGELAASGEALAAVPFPYPFPARKNFPTASDPSILLYDVEDEIVGSVHFPVNRFTADSIQRFVRNFIGFIEAMVSTPDAHVRAIAIRP